MIMQADKEKLLNEFEEKYVFNRCIGEAKKIVEEYKVNKSVIQENIILKFDLACKEAILLQKKELKGEIKYIYFSILRTSLLENRGEWRVDLYDQKWFLDKEECSIDIRFDFIYKRLFKHMEELLERKSEFGRNISEIDIDEIRLKEAEIYHFIAINIIKDLIGSLLECNSYKEMKKEEGISIRAGEFMDSTVLLYAEQQ